MHDDSPSMYGKTRIAFFALFIICLIGLLVLKICEIHYEPVQVNMSDAAVTSKWTIAHTIGYGIIRRIDDARFWIIVGIGLSYLRLRKVDAAHKIASLKRYWITGACISLIYVVAMVLYYYFSVKAGRGAFFWNKTAGENGWTQSAINAVRKIQWIEGSVNMLLILIAGGVSFYASITVGRVVNQIKRSPEMNVSDRVGSMEQLFSSLLTILVAVPLYFGLVTVLIDLANIKFEFSATHPAKALGYTVLYGSPFLLLFAMLLIQWIKYLEDVSPLAVIKRTIWEPPESK